MPASTSEWDAKHRAAAVGPPGEPAGFVLELLPLLPLGPALDLACGTGRHTLLLASRQQVVTAVDSSSVALEILEQRALICITRFAHQTTGTECEPMARDSVVASRSRRGELAIGNILAGDCVNYLQRSLSRRLKEHWLQAECCCSRLSQLRSSILRWAAEPGLPSGIRGAADCVSFAATFVLSGVAGWEGNCELIAQKAAD